MKPAYVYILHFQSALHHAMHYCGSTEALVQRLDIHAIGHGSKLTKALAEAGIPWSLGSLFQVPRTKRFRVERYIKNTGHLHQFCGLCTEQPKRPTGTMPIEINALKINTSSSLILTHRRIELPPADVRFTRPDEPTATIKLIKHLQSREKCLGFIPVGGTDGLNTLIQTGRVVIANVNGEPVGYAAFTRNLARTEARIHQIAVVDKSRLQGNGKAMIETIQAAMPDSILTAVVRLDLPANDFWKASGFNVIQQYVHGTSGNPLNLYQRTPKQEQEQS